MMIVLRKGLRAGESGLVLPVPLKRKHRIARLISYLLFWTLLISCAAIKPSLPYRAEGEEYQASLDQGWEYHNKRQHRRALEIFSQAAVLRPAQAEPLYGRAQALFAMARFDGVLEACEEISGKTADRDNALGFCWGARLEISRAAPPIQKEVRREIEQFLQVTDEPAVELLYSAYQGYYYLKDQEKRLALILRLAERGADSAMAGGIAGSLFEEVITAAPGSEMQIKLAGSYVRNFPGGRMADQAAAIVLRDLLDKQAADPDYEQIARTISGDGEKSPLLNRAVAIWLIDQETGYDQAIGLLQKNLQGLEARRLEVPEHFSPTLWQQEIDKERLFYKYLLGRAWLGNGEAAKAAKLFDQVLAVRQDWAGVYHYRGMIALADGLSEQAIRDFRTALARGDTRPETNRELRLLLEEYYGFRGEPRAYFQAQEGGVRFTDLTDQAGLGKVKAGRVAWGDYDHDGDEDLLLDGSRLFTNQANGGFVEADQLLPAALNGANGGIWGDYDNDGWPDIFVTSHRGNHLLHNEAGARFTRSEALPVEGDGPLSTEAAAWGDLNNDGFLDLYVANYEHGAVMRGQCGQDRLLVNRGGTTFREAGAEAGIISEEAMCGRGVTWSDLNSDGWQDIVVSNYRLDPNFFWRNWGDGSLVDVAESARVQGNEVDGAYGHSIGSASGDLDGDGDFDLFIANLAHPRYIEFSDQSMVLINNGGTLPAFTDRFAESGIFFDETSSDPQFLDVDNDGDLDLFITSIYRDSSSHLYLNDGQGRFADRTWLAGAGVLNGWGAASADYDGDGYLDLLVASGDGVRLLHNEGGSQNWLAVRIDDRNCNRFGVGSKVFVDYGGQSQVREVTAGRGTGSQDSLAVHFGLGDYFGPVSVQVKTLCGDNLQRRIKGLNRIVTITNNQENK